MSWTKEEEERGRRGGGEGEERVGRGEEKGKETTRGQRIEETHEKEVQAKE